MAERQCEKPPTSLLYDPPQRVKGGNRARCRRHMEKHVDAKAALIAPGPQRPTILREAKCGYVAKHSGLQCPSRGVPVGSDQAQHGIRQGSGQGSNHEEAETVIIDLVPTTDVVFGEVRPGTNEGDDGVQTSHA